MKTLELAKIVLKRSVLTAMAILMILGSGACSAQVQKPQITPEQVTAQISEATPQPVETKPASTPTATPQPTPDMNTELMDVAALYLNDPRVLGGEDTATMTDNMGGMFGAIDIKQPSEDGSYFQFISGDGGAWMPYNTRLLDVGEHRGNTQAFMIKFQSVGLQNLQFNFIGMGEVFVTFSDGNRPSFVNVEEAIKHPYSEYMPSDLTLEADVWYFALFAFDTNGNFRSVIWEDGKTENMAVYEEPLGEQRDDYKESNWEVVIGLDANSALNVQNYWIMDFEDFAQIS